MHYKNHRKAVLGDLVIGTTFNIEGIIVGELIEMTSGHEYESCNCKVLVKGTPDYSKLENLVHIEDVWELMKNTVF